MGTLIVGVFSIPFQLILFHHRLHQIKLNEFIHNRFANECVDKISLLFIKSIFVLKKKVNCYRIFEGVFFPLSCLF